MLLSHGTGLHDARCGKMAARGQGSILASAAACARDGLGADAPFGGLSV